MNKKEKGTILVLVVGVLAILSLMAATLVTMMKLQADMAGNYRDDSKLELLGQSALEYGIGVLISDRNHSSANDYDSITEQWTTAFNGSDVQVWPLSGGVDSRWFDVENADGQKIGSFALKIIDQSALIYANESTTAIVDIYAQYNAIASAGTADSMARSTTGMTYPNVEMVRGVDTDLIPYYFATSMYQSDTDPALLERGADGPLNINTHLEMFSAIGGGATLIPTLLSGATNISAADRTTVESDLVTHIVTNGNPLTVTSGFASIETRIASLAVAGDENKTKNDVLNTLVNFTAGTTGLASASPNPMADPGATYRAAGEIYYNCNFTATPPKPVGLDPGDTANTELNGYVLSADLPGTATSANDLGAGKDPAGNNIVRREIIFKSSIFEVWGQAKGFDYENNVEYPGIRAFVATIDRGLVAGDQVKVISFRWLPPDYMTQYETYY